MSSRPRQRRAAQAIEPHERDAGARGRRLSSSSRPPGRLTLAAYRTADGALLRTLHTWDHAQGYEPGMAVGGNQLLIWAIYQPSTFQVDLATGRAKPFWVYTPAGEFPEAVAW